MKIFRIRIVIAAALSSILLVSMSGKPEFIRAFDATPTPIPAQPANDPASWPIISTENAQYLTLAGIYGHGKNTHALWARDGHTLIVGSDRGVWLYDTRTPAAPPRGLNEPDLPVKGMALSHDGKSFAVTAGQTDSHYGVGGSIRVWDVATGILQMSFSASEEVIHFSPDDTQIIGEQQEHHHCCGGEIAVWDAIAKYPLAQVTARDLYPEGFIVQQPLYPQGYVVRFGSQLKLAALIDSKGVSEIWSIPHGIDPKGLFGKPEGQHLTDIANDKFLIIQPDKGILALNWLGHSLWLFDLYTGKLIDTIDTSLLSEPDMTISPDGTTRVAVENGVVKLRDAQTDDLKAVLPGTPVSDFAFSSDDRTLALTSSDNYVDIIDVASGRVKFSLVGHTAPVLHAIFSPDGQWIATIGADKTVRLWDAVTGHQGRLWAPGDAEITFAFSLDSQVLAVGDTQNVVRLWNVNTGQLRAKLHGPSAVNLGMEFHPNGLLSVYSNDGLIQWDWNKSEEHDISFDIADPSFPLETLYLRQVMQVSPDGSESIVFANYGCDVPSILLVSNLDSHIISVIDKCPFYEYGYTFSPDGKLLVSVGNLSGNDGLHGPAYVYVSISVKTRKVKTLPSIDGAQDFGRVAFSAGGRIVAAINEEGALVLWRVAIPSPVF